MQVTKEPLEPCQVALTIEVEPDKVVHAVDRAYKEYAKYVSVPGFRKGKAPMSFVRQRIPEPTSASAPPSCWSSRPTTRPSSKKTSSPTRRRSWNCCSLT